MTALWLIETPSPKKPLLGSSFHGTLSPSSPLVCVLSCISVCANTNVNLHSKVFPECISSLSDGGTLKDKQTHQQIGLRCGFVISIRLVPFHALLAGLQSCCGFRANKAQLNWICQSANRQWWERARLRNKGITGKEEMYEKKKRGDRESDRSDNQQLNSVFILLGDFEVSN